MSLPARPRPQEASFSFLTPQPHGASVSSSSPFLAAGQTMRRPLGSITGQHAHFFGASLMAQMVKNLPAVWKTQVRSLGGEDPLEEGMATYCSILAWRIPWTERSLADYGPWSRKKSDMTERLTHTRTCTHTHTHAHTHTRTHTHGSWEGHFLHERWVMEPGRCAV